MSSIKRSMSDLEFPSHFSIPSRQIASGRQGFGIQAESIFGHASGCQCNMVAVASLMALLFLTGAVGCGGVVKNGASSSSTGSTAKLTATPSAIDFGTVSIGMSANQKVTISNAGSASVEITKLALTDAAFTVDGQGKLPVTLEAGKNLDLNVHYNPTDSIDSTGNLDVLVGAFSTSS